jgi:hypothetical protein
MNPKESLMKIKVSLIKLKQEKIKMMQILLKIKNNRQIMVIALIMMLKQIIQIVENLSTYFNLLLYLYLKE